MPDLLPWLPALVGIIGGAFGLWSAYVNRGGQRRGRREPTWGELLKRVTDLEGRVEDMEKTERRKMGAVLRILRAIATQWPTPSGPDLDPRDIELIEETIPPQWIRRTPPI